MEAEDPPIAVDYSGVEAQPGPRARNSVFGSGNTA